MAWVDDFFLIDLEKVRDPELDPNWTRTKSYARADLERAVDELKEIQRLIRDEGYVSADFERMRQSMDRRERSLGGTHHKFYDSGQAQDVIKVDWRGDHYEITNGQHRIAIAKQRGLRHIPARISAPDRVTLERLRNESERSAPTDPRRAQGATPPWERRPSRSPVRNRNRER